MPPWRGLPPLLFCVGTGPIQAAKWRAEAELDTSPVVAVSVPPSR
jgi:hypothetical protein